MEVPQLLVLYGSQTGTAHDVAERIFRDGKRHHFSAKVMAMDDYPIVSHYTDKEFPTSLNEIDHIMTCHQN